MAKTHKEKITGQQIPQDQKIENEEYIDLLNKHNELIMAIINERSLMFCKSLLEEARLLYQPCIHHLSDYSVIPSPEQLMREVEAKFRKYEMAMV